MKKLFIALMAVAPLTAAQAADPAQDYPSRPIRVMGQGVREWIEGSF